MSERLIHYYDVISGKCVCGAPANSEDSNFAVFQEQVTCPECLKLLRNPMEKAVRRESGEG
jgi:hypothetical protein